MIENWEKLKELFDRALSLSDQQRDTFLRDVSAVDAEIGAELQRLIEYHKAAGSFLESDDKTPDTFIQGQIVAGRYRVVTRLGRGGMGEVYEALDTELNEKIALKTVQQDASEDDTIATRLIQELQLARKITHPNVCRVYDIGRHTEDVSQTIFLTMELIQGETLAARLRREEKLTPESSLHIARRVADGIDAAHACGIVHRDLKPANIMLADDGRIVIMDFGLARDSDSRSGGSLTKESRIFGTPGYISPEQLAGHRATRASDIYAFGVVLHEMLTGTKPTDEANETGVCLSDTKPVWNDIVLRCLDPRPSDRFQNAAQVIRALEQRLSTPLPVNFKTILEGPGGIEGATPSESKNVWNRVLQRRYLPYALAGFSLSATAVAGFWRWGGNPETLAVLPFENASADNSLEYLSDGITETLINSLSQVPEFRVPAAGLVRQFKGQSNPTKAGGVLNASAVLTGRIREANGLLSVQAELIDVRSGRQIWGDQYNLAWTNVLNIQESICAGILSGLRLPLGSHEAALRRGLTTNDEAFRIYLRGQYLLRLRTVDSLREARDLFTEALQRDPKFALAFAGLASTHVLLGYFGVDAPTTSMPAARAASEQAIAIEPSVAEAHSVLAFVKAIFDWDWTGADAEFKQAIALKQSLAEAHHWYAVSVLNPMGRSAQAIVEMHRALTSDPLSLIVHTNLAVTLYYARRFDEAIERLQKVIEMNPSFPLSYWTLGQIWGFKRNLDKGVDALDKARRLEPGPKPDLSLAYCYAVCGRRDQAAKLLDQVLNTYQRPSYSAYEMAYVQTALGNSGAAFASLDIAYKEKEPQLIDLGMDPKFDVLRKEPGFSDIVRRIRLNPAAYG